jgi:hypothetical protein
VFQDAVQLKTPRLGFNIAFGIINDATLKSLEGFEETGSLQATTSVYNKGQYYDVPLPIHKCTEEDKKKFYKPN